MKELFTKIFWDGVKKTFHDGIEGTSPEDKAPHDPTTVLTEEPSPPPVSSEPQ